jgi:hypothetical protein
VSNSRSVTLIAGARQLMKAECPGKNCTDREGGGCAADDA